MSTANLAALTTDAIAGLGSAQIKALTTAQIVALTTDQVAALGTDQVAALSSAQVSALESGDIALFSTAAEVAVISTAAIGAISSDDYMTLTNDQLDAISSDQVAALKDNVNWGHRRLQRQHRILIDTGTVQTVPDFPPRKGRCIASPFLRYLPHQLHRISLRQAHCRRRTESMRAKRRPARDCRSVQGDVGKLMNMTVPATSVDPVAVIQAVFQRARQQQLPLAELIQTVERLSSLGASAPALDLYKTWIAFNDKNPMVHVASFNYAVMLNQTGDAAGAIQALKATIAYKSDFAPAHINLGRVYEDCQMVGRAVEQWRNFANTSNEITAERLSFRLMALKHMGRVLETSGLLEEAEAVLWLAIELDPSKQDASQHWLATRQHQCKWRFSQAPNMSRVSS